jgi:iron(II)-dependent oxidoreductase
LTLLSIIDKTTKMLRGSSASPDAESDGPDEHPLVAKMGHEVGDDQYCLRLAAENPQPPSEEEAAAAWQTLQDRMALVPAGETTLRSPLLAGPENAGDEPAEKTVRVRVRSAYLDRHAVTNAEFARFIAGGGYRHAELWPAQILPHVLHFVDQNGRPGPRYWSNGQPPEGKEDHPVVGVAWYEAAAYARWVGKRLPTPAEWQRAGCWCDGERSETKFPWGNAFDPKRANTWLGGPADTVPVGEYYEGCTSNGIYQLVGNVWEWVAAAFECECMTENSQVEFDQPMGEIRGGAFDTYFESQANCLFRSGQPLLHRLSNVGFRCCIAVDDLQPLPKPFAFLNSAAPK